MVTVEQPESGIGMSDTKLHRTRRMESCRAYVDQTFTLFATQWVHESFLSALYAVGHPPVGVLGHPRHALLAGNPLSLVL
jgi:hypothetical protein